jgi:hypothetical protein
MKLHQIFVLCWGQFESTRRFKITTPLAATLGFILVVVLHVSDLALVEVAMIVMFRDADPHAYLSTVENWTCHIGWKQPG